MEKRPSPETVVDTYYRIEVSIGLFDNFKSRYHAQRSSVPREYQVDWGLFDDKRILDIYYRSGEVAQRVLITDEVILFEEFSVSGRVSRQINTISAVERAERFMDVLAPMREDDPFQ